MKKILMLSTALFFSLTSQCFSANAQIQPPDDDADNHVIFQAIKYDMGGNTLQYFADLDSSSAPYFNLFSNVKLDGVNLLDRLTAKADVTHTHAITDVVGLSSALASKAAVTHSHTSSDITDFTEAAQDSTATLLQNGTGISWSYNDASNTLTPTVSVTSVSGNAGTATALSSNGTNCSAGNYPLGVDTSGNAESCTAVPAAYTYTETVSADNSHATSTSTGAVGWQPSATKPTHVCYLVNTSTTASIGGPGVSTVNLEVAPTNSATAGDWIVEDQVSNTQTVTLAIALQSVQNLSHNVCADVPVAYYVKLRSLGSGTHAESMTSGWKTLKG